jgi:uncharacterized protein (DUF2141 family)
MTALGAAVTLASGLVHPARAAQGAGSIAGVVVSTDTPPQPVRRAIVSVSGPGIPSNLSVVSDDRGRFAIRNLAPGRYAVRASKAAFLPATYGAAQPGAPGTAVAVVAGQTADIRIAVTRGAVITGTVRDHLGHPAPGVEVTVTPAKEIASPGGVRLDSDSIFTDDRGVYRAFGLTPGEYVVSAFPRVAGSGQIFQMSASDIDARLRALQQQAGGSSGVGAMPPPAAMRRDELAPINTQPAFGYAATFHPGTPIAADAARVKVAAGDVREGIDIPLLPVRAARIDGTIASGDVEATRVRPTLTALGPALPVLGRETPRLIGPGADGSFAFEGVTPGRYLLMARTGMGAMMMQPGGRGSTSNNPGVPSRFAMQELAIDGADVSGVTLTLRPALSLSGRIAFDAAALTPPAKLAGIRVTLTTGAAAAATVINDLGLGSGPAPAATVQPDGTFTIVGIVPGTYGIASAVPGGSPSARWWLRSAVAEGRDLLDHPLEIGSTTSDLTNVVLTFTDRRNELTGTLSSATGAPASEYMVVVFPADESYWRPGARRLRSTRPASDGAFSVVDLPAGEYRIAALADVDPDEWQHPDFLRQLVPASVKVAIADGQSTRQDLRIAR